MIRDLVVVHSTKPIYDTPSEFEVVNCYPTKYGCDGLALLVNTYVTFLLCTHGYTILHDLLFKLDIFGAYSYVVAGHFIEGCEVQDA